MEIMRVQSFNKRTIRISIVAPLLGAGSIFGCKITAFAAFGEIFRWQNFRDYSTLHSATPALAPGAGEISRRMAVASTGSKAAVLASPLRVG